MCKSIKHVVDIHNPTGFCCMRTLARGCMPFLIKIACLTNEGGNVREFSEVTVWAMVPPQTYQYLTQFFLLCAQTFRNCSELIVD